MNADGSAPTILTSAAGLDEDPEWQPAVDLMTSVRASRLRLRVRGIATIRVRVRNVSPLSADAVRVANTIRRGAVVSASASSGSCSRTVCRLGVLKQGVERIVTLKIRALRVGRLTISVSASSRMSDANRADNAAVATILVRARR